LHKVILYRSERFPSACYKIPVTRRVKGYTRFVGKIPVTRRVKGYTRFVGKLPVTRRVKGYTRFVGKYVSTTKLLFTSLVCPIFIPAENWWENNMKQIIASVFIPVGRVKGYTRFVGKYVTGRGKRICLNTNSL